MPIQNPLALLAHLEAQVEGGWVEFKHNNTDPQMIGENISAIANAAMLEGRDRGYLVFGIDDESRARVGTSSRLSDIRKGNENLINWLSRMVEPRIMLECVDFEADGMKFSIIAIEPTYDRPVRFGGVEYLRIGQNTRKLVEFPEHERALWIVTGRRKFEDAVAVSNQAPDDVFAKLDVAPLFELTGEPRPRNEGEILRKMVERKFLIDNHEGGFDITNLGAILLARELSLFPTIAGKSIRVIGYAGRDKSKSDFETEGHLGYAVGFKGLIGFLQKRLPTEERYVDGVRRMVPVYPATAIRELIANALIHQDFNVAGQGPVVEVYENRVEITNAGSSLVDPDRMIDERRSRNERLAQAMRSFGLCEERGGGLDKTLLEIEALHLPAPEFVSSADSMRVVLFGPRPFNEMSKADRTRACFFHCVLRWLQHDFMSNSTLRERFQLPDVEYQAVSAVIAEAIKLGRIAPADPNQGKRNAKYVPYWAAV